ncbi:hypothetical protein SAMN05421858_1535 [Haladaptatus litoreus]|uniref:Uncharacterized protein n=1 Tax=Haladaptatus litoreus TaxID=553468 RepID=A0A1N6YEX5_9EURY|nr:hypothetical protein [Haladaptatus litoreus]SIR13056.1 hypothetical protein SAMN05421858_1535 [Haladaptatus litoreus]
MVSGKIGFFGRFARDDRGQLLLVGAVVIAISLVAVVVVLNTVLYTENVTNSEPIATTGDARDIALVVDGDIEPVVHRTNYAERHDSAAESRTAVAESIAEYETLLGVTVARRTPASLHVEVSNQTVGNGVEHDSGAAFVDAANESNWTLARNADVRRYLFSVNRSSLATTDSDAFRIQVEGRSENWNLSVLRQDDDVVLRTDGSTVAASSTCTVTSEQVRIDLRNGSASECSFPFADGVGDDYDIEYENGANASGTYSVLFNGTDAEIPPSSVNSESSESPYRTHAVYELDARLTYTTPELTYRTTFNATLYQP